MENTKITAEQAAELLKKSERILRGNIYDKTGYPWDGYTMVFPARGRFPGIWNWDKAFIAVGMIPYDIDIAKDQIEGFLSFQKDKGILPDVIFEDGRIVDMYSKPPVMAHAAMRVFEASNDLKFLERVYPKLEKNTRFWEKERKNGGMFHYDADRSDGCGDEEYLKRVRFETGWDNSPRWDGGEPQNLWTVDLNCYMVMTYRAMRKMADALCVNASEWDEKAEELSRLIEQRLWNEKLLSYTDYDFVKNAHSDTLTPASFMPMYIKISSGERALCMEKTAKEHFMPGMPTVAYTDPSFETDAYWRGPCWLNVAYFAAKGLKNYGFHETADTIKNTILGWVCNDGEYIHENYDPVTGEGLCTDRFSWSCVFVREFLENF
ncbi:MAG TPA: hypothetical protein IAA61_09230 [Candidatus Ornithomonoglobus merdipullorum]|uniref:Mannosylglycerate hydrolase MGH1-like glycoside hydrolase domain-containing protein n=1 Tax=Candidatus Ornithomonoglobus merdipullorum TaxID=2840895 RepID=A0A9D1MDD1_9FIRM|nr:hypothetical protein [Candidatus Ornithomonoglobus merdipullorum]